MPAPAASFAKEISEDEQEFQADLLTGENEIALIKKIAEFDLVIDRAARELKPHHLATYARELAESFNLFYRYSPVLDAAPKLTGRQNGSGKSGQKCAAHDSGDPGHIRSGDDVDAYRQ